MVQRRTLRKKKGSGPQKGGKQIQEGTQGCTQYPALKCKGAATREEGMVSKIMPDARAVAEEMEAADAIRNVDPEMKHSIYPTKACAYDPATVDPAENNMGSCRLLEEINSEEMEDTQLLLLPQGGSDLGRLKLKPEEYVAFFETQQDVLKGVKLQHDRGIVHMDIKPPNIVTKSVGRGKFETKQIDFGLSLSRDMNPEMLRERIFMNDYEQWPWELRILSSEFDPSYHLTDKKWENFAQTHVIHRKERFPQEVWLDPRTHKVHESVKTAFREMANDQNTGSETVRKELSEGILKKADVQSLGRTLQEVQNRFTGHGIAQGQFRVDQVDFSKWKTTVSAETAAFHERLQEGLSKPLFELCMKMLQPALDDRCSIDEALVFQKEKVKPKWKVFFGDRNALQEGLQPVIKWIEKPIPKVKTPVMKTPVFGEREKTMFGHNNKFETNRGSKTTTRKKPWWLRRREKRREAATTRKNTRVNAPPPPPSNTTSLRRHIRG